MRVPTPVRHGRPIRSVRQDHARTQQQEPAAAAALQPDDEDERLAGDVLLGAKRIAEHLTSILGVPVNETDVYYARRMQKLPIGKYGILLIASKRRLAKHVEKLTRGPVA